MSTISTIVHQGITLSQSGSYQSPLTITVSGGVVNSNTSAAAGAGDAIYGPGTAAWTISNAGTVGAAGYDGIDLKLGGSVFNAGSIAGANVGVYIGGAGGTVANSGTIGSLNDANYGVLLNAGGYVGNSGTGYVGGGVEIGGAAGALVNAATISDSIADGVRLLLGGTVTDSGVVTAAGNGVELDAGGYVGVDATGIVTATGLGIYLAGSGIVVNSGSVVSAAGGNFAVDLNQGGSIVNNRYLLGGIEVNNAAGNIVNSGTDIGTTGDGVLLAAGGSVVDTGLIVGGINGVEADSGATVLVGLSGSIGAANFGVYITGGAGTVILGGTIGGGASGVVMDGTGSNLLVVYGTTGRVGGGVYGNVAAQNTLELAGSPGVPATVDYNLLGLTNFQDARFGPVGYETLQVSNTSGTLPVVVSGFTAAHKYIDFTSILLGTVTQPDASHRITIGNALQTVTVQLDPGDNFSGLTFETKPDGLTGTEVFVACYCRGTLIRTCMGERSVEDLEIGERVVTLSGAARPIKWIGRRSYDGRFIRGNPGVLPIIVKAGALGEGSPCRDLCLSPKHALYIDGVLVPAECLVDGDRVLRCEGLERVDYFHIELDSHDVIFAEGAPAETFVDCDSRGMFHNAHEFAERYPGEEPARWAFCAPRVEAGEALAAVRRRLDRRCGRGRFDRDVERLLGRAAAAELASADAASLDRTIAFLLAQSRRLIVRRAELATARGKTGKRAFSNRIGVDLLPRAPARAS